jgi:hypothetical protein
MPCWASRTSFLRSSKSRNAENLNSSGDSGVGEALAVGVALSVGVGVGVAEAVGDGDGVASSSEVEESENEERAITAIAKRIPALCHAFNFEKLLHISLNIQQLPIY